VAARPAAVAHLPTPDDPQALAPRGQLQAISATRLHSGPGDLAAPHARIAAPVYAGGPVHPRWLAFPHSPRPLLPHIPAVLLPYSWLGLAIAVALVLNGVFITYLVTLLSLFLRRRPGRPGDHTKFGWHFLIPCRDEAAVIGGTLGYLREHFPDAHAWVIDDDSEDATAAIVTEHAAASPNIHLVARKRPEARTGKSEALNVAYRRLSDWIDAEPAVDRPNTIVAVVDADGRLAPGCLDVVAADHLFGDPRTGAVQIEVRMINRNDPRPVPHRGRARNLLGRVLIRLQDMEFRAVCSAVQLSRRVVRTVAMGGNGQFMRLTVLDSIGGDARRPWRGSLQEDFEIGLHALLSGSRTEYTPDTYVDQEALPDPARLLTQRTRWSQGMMQCIRYLPSLWTSRHVTGGGLVELAYCLVQPWIQLGATLLFPLPWLVLGVTYLRHPALAADFGAAGGWTLLALYIVAAASQLAAWGLVYWWRCDRGIGVLRGVGYGVAFTLLVYLSYLATWRAAFRIVRRRQGWAKTRRNAEFTAAST
jgi:cellulose synthase/poly-beta-1,6-N-acetylglucosamine synthase-like glycosyltransferase